MMVQRQGSHRPHLRGRALVLHGLVIAILALPSLIRAEVTLGNRSALTGALAGGTAGFGTPDAESDTDGEQLEDPNFTIVNRTADAAVSADAVIEGVGTATISGASAVTQHAELTLGTDGNFKSFSFNSNVSSEGAVITFVGSESGVSAEAFLETRVVFTVTSPTAFALSGSMDLTFTGTLPTPGTFGRGSSADGQVKLHGGLDDGGSLNVFDYVFNINATPSGTLLASGTLQPGFYTFDVLLGSGVFLGLAGVNDGSATGAGSFTFTLGTTGGDFVWELPVDGSFDDASKWEADAVPGTSDTVKFTKPGAYQVALTGNSVSRALLTAGDITFAGPASLGLLGGGFGESLSVGDAGLTLDAHATLSSVDAAIGAGTGQGSMTVTGAGTAWNNSGALHVGGTGPGFLFIEDTATATSGATTIGGFGGGNAIVRGVLSNWTTQDLDIGAGGNGDFVVSNGATVGSIDVTIGQSAGDIGHATVETSTASGSTSWAAQRIVVGEGGSGSLKITDGSLVVIGRLEAAGASAATGSISVDGPGSVFSVVDDAILAVSGSASFNVTNGAVATVGNDLICGVFGFGTMSVDSSSASGRSMLEAKTLEIGGGDGFESELFIDHGSVVKSDSGFVGKDAGEQGRVSIRNASADGHGSLWQVAGSLTIGQQGKGRVELVNQAALLVGLDLIVGNADQGTVSLTNSAVGVGRDVIVGLPGRIEGTGVLAVGGVVNNAGTISPGL